MLFKDIPGHKELKSYFTNLISQDRLPHAMLFTGGEGYGKLAMALGLASYLQCSNRSEHDACGTCANCVKATQYIHPDIHFAFPVVKKDKLTRAETTSKHFLPEWRSMISENPYTDLNGWLTHLGASDKNANINVAECNQVIKNLSLMTYEGEHKIQIIWYADVLGKEGNRLLKLIEEPAPHTLIILIAHNRSAVLNTLRSRCQLISVPPVDDDALLQYIDARFDFSDMDTKELAYLAAGNIRKATLLSAHNEMNYSEDLLSWLRACYKGDPEELVATSESLVEMGRQELVNFFQYGLHFFREYFVLLNTQQADLLRLTAPEKEAAIKLQKLIDHGKTEALQNKMELSITHVHRNLHLKSMVLHLSLEINHILRSEVNTFV